MARQIHGRPNKQGDTASEAVLSSKGINLSESQSTSWFKVMRSDETLELLKDPPTFVLLTLIAYRAQRTATFNRHELEPNQAFIGDHKACGLSEQQYRTAKGKLAKWKFATFKATNKGTVVTLINTRVFCINAESINGQINSPSTDRQRTGNGRATTTNNVKNAENEKRGGTSAPTILKMPEQISLEKELQRVTNEIRQLGMIDEYPSGSKKQLRLIELLKRQKDLRGILGVVA